MKYSDFIENEVGRAACVSLPLIHKPNIRIEFPPNNERARKVISRSNAKATGKYPSWKMGRMMHYESPHERNAFRLLDSCSEVKLFREQPCKIFYVMNDETRLHYPDILVELPWGKELWEVKTAADAITPEVARRTEFMELALPLLGYGYRLMQGEQLAQLPRLGIVKKLLRSGRSPVLPIEREQIRQLFKYETKICWGVFKPGSAGGKYYNQICRLILEGYLKIDFNHPLTDESPIQALHFNGSSTW